MRAVEITQAFTGYPDDTVESERHFAPGEVPELSDAYAALVVAKGYARAPGPRLPVLPSEPEAAAIPATETTPT